MMGLHPRILFGIVLCGLLSSGCYKDLASEQAPRIDRPNTATPTPIIRLTSAPDEPPSAEKEELHDLHVEMTSRPLHGTTTIKVFGPTEKEVSAAVADLQLPPGTYTLVVASEGYGTLKKRFDVPKNKNLEVALDPIPGYLAKKKEQERLANLEKMGIWGIGGYVDSFGDKTGEHFVYGQFNGVCKLDGEVAAELEIQIRVTQDLVVFEITVPGGSWPDIKKDLSIRIKDTEGNKTSTRASLKNSTLTVDARWRDLGVSEDTQPEAVTKALMKGGQVQFFFKIADDVECLFTIPDASYFSNAYRKMREKQQ